MTGRHRPSAQETEQPHACSAVATVTGSWARSMRASWLIVLTALMIRIDGRVVADVLVIILMSKH